MRIFRKLKNKRGASAILGLMFFFICFFVCSVVISAASVNITRARAQIEEQQAFLAINAADALLRQEFSKIESYSASEIITKHDCHIDPNEYSYQLDGVKVKNLLDEETGTEVLQDCVVKDIAENLGKQAFFSKTEVDYSAEEDVDELDPTTWKYEFVISANGMKDVHVSMTTDASCNLYAEMTVPSKYAVEFTSTLKIKAISKTEEKTVTSTTDYCTHQVSRTRDVDGVILVEYVDTNFYNKITTKTTTIKWDKFETVKGHLITGDATTTTEVTE